MNYDGIEITISDDSWDYKKWLDLKQIGKNIPH